MNRPWEEEFVHWAGDPTDPRLHAPLNPVAAILQPDRRAGRDHQRTDDVAIERVLEAVRATIQGRGGTMA